MNKATLLFALGICTLAFGQSPNLSVPLQPRSAGAASFVCGGVGFEEQQAIKAQAAQYDLALTFAVSSGAYLADVDVQIQDAKGAVVLSARCDGPIMLVDLPRGGTWRVTAQIDGQSRHKTLSAGAGRHARATLIWPAGAS